MPEQKIEIKTPLGTIVATPTGDTNYPGIQVELRQEGIPYTMGLAVIECSCAETEAPELRTHVWGDALDEDPTVQVTHTGVTTYFTP